MSVLDPMIFLHKFCLHSIDHVPTWFIVSWRWYLLWLQDLECNAYIEHFQSITILSGPVDVFLINPLCMLNQTRNINAILVGIFLNKIFHCRNDSISLGKAKWHPPSKGRLNLNSMCRYVFSHLIGFDSLRSFRDVQVIVLSFHFIWNFQPTVVCRMDCLTSLETIHRSFFSSASLSFELFCIPYISWRWYLSVSKFIIIFSAMRFTK